MEPLDLPIKSSSYITLHIITSYHINDDTKYSKVLSSCRFNNSSSTPENTSSVSLLPEPGLGTLKAARRPAAFLGEPPRHVGPAKKNRTSKQRWKWRGHAESSRLTDLLQKDQEYPMFDMTMKQTAVCMYSCQHQERQVAFSGSHWWDR